jgi:glutamyl-tRNA reductase
MQRLGALGMTFREAPASARAALLAVDLRDDAPSAELLTKGYVDGVTRIETCSRVEWVVSSPRVRWAVELLESSLLRRADLKDVRLKRSYGAGAALHVLRVSLGLDSLVEGEAAVGRQLARAFRKGRDLGHTDRVLHLVWKRLERARHEARADGLLRNGFGIQTLVRDALVESEIAGVVPLFGRGDIGKSVQRALEAGPWREAPAYGRGELATFLAQAKRAPAVVICSGAPEPWLDLPLRDDAPLAVDVGFPAQLRSASGWRVVPLDALLVRPECHLEESSKEALERLASDAVEALCDELERSASHDALAALDTERRVFLHEELPRLLAGLPSPDATRIRAGVGAFAHRLIRRAGRST